MNYEDLMVGILVVTRRPVDEIPEGTLGRITQVMSDPWEFSVLWDWALHHDRYPHSLWLDSEKLVAFERVTDKEAEEIRKHHLAAKYRSKTTAQLILPFDAMWDGPQPRQPNPMRFGGGRW